MDITVAFLRILERTVPDYDRLDILVRQLNSIPFRIDERAVLERKVLAVASGNIDSGTVFRGIVSIGKGQIPNRNRRSVEIDGRTFERYTLASSTTSSLNETGAVRTTVFEPLSTAEAIAFWISAAESTFTPGTTS